MSINPLNLNRPVNKNLNEIHNALESFNENHSFGMAVLNHSKASISIFDVQEWDKNLYEPYQKVRNIITDRLNGIKSQRGIVRDHDLPDYLYLTDAEDLLQKMMQQFHEKVLNIHPNAKISYGSRCVSETKTWDAQDLKKKDLVLISSQFPACRKIRGDGNCYYSSLAVTYLDYLCRENKIGEALETILRNDHIDSSGKDEVIKALFELSTDPSVENREKIFSDNSKVLSFVHYFRKAASTYIQNHQEDFSFIKEDPNFGSNVNLTTFCQTEIEEMGTNADFPAILALAKVFKFPVCILNPRENTSSLFDFSGNNATIDIRGYPFIFEKSAAFIYRDEEHYFVLSKTSAKAPIKENPKNEENKNNNTPITLSTFQASLKSKNPQEIKDSFSRLPPEMITTLKKGFWFLEGMPYGDSDFGNTFLQKNPTHETIEKTVQLVLQNGKQIFENAVIADFKKLIEAKEHLAKAEPKEVKAFLNSLTHALEIIKKAIWVETGKKPIWDYAATVIENTPKDKSIFTVIDKLSSAITPEMEPAKDIPKVEEKKSNIFSDTLPAFQFLVSLKNPQEIKDAFSQLPPQVISALKKGFWFLEGMPSGDDDFGNTFFQKNPTHETVEKTIENILQNGEQIFDDEVLGDLKTLVEERERLAKAEPKEVKTFFSKLIHALEIIKKAIWVETGKKPIWDYAATVIENNPKDKSIFAVIDKIAKALKLK